MTSHQPDFLQSGPSLFERVGGHDGLMKLLNHFYADVRQHSLLGPIFNGLIEDWPSHLEVIARFWATVTGGPSEYSGKMPARHIPLSLKEEHFLAWLGMWKHNCQIYLPEDCATEMIDVADSVASRFRKFCGVTS
jgi:hemoglobin